MTTFHVQVADNGYIVKDLEETGGLTVYEGSEVSEEMLNELLDKMIDDLHRGADELLVSVSVKKRDYSNSSNLGKSENCSADKIEPKKLDADKVIGWLIRYMPIFWDTPCNPQQIVEQFKEDFGL